MLLDVIRRAWYKPLWETNDSIRTKWLWWFAKEDALWRNVVTAKYVVNKLARAELENFIWGGRGPPSSMYEIRVCVCP